MGSTPTASTISKLLILKPPLRVAFTFVSKTCLLCLVGAIREQDSMATTPTITIFVRYSKGCKYAGDEFAKRCDCRKWLRWTATGEPRQRRPANTRSWAEAEQVKRDIEDQLTGRTVVPDTSGARTCERPSRSSSLTRKSRTSPLTSYASMSVSSDAWRRSARVVRLYPCGNQP